MPNFKSPGPEGFGPSFYRSAWKVAKDDLVSNIQSFFQRGNLTKEWNKTFITLIPKTDSPQNFADYRPISLCNFNYKIISKILAERLKPILPRIIPKRQFAFVKERFILDNIFLAQELLYKLCHAKASRALMAIKLDLHKAYDSIKWECIIKVMR